MGAAGDIEKQAGAAVDRHQRRIAIAPVGNGGEEAGIRRLVGHGGIERRPDGLGLGQPLHRFQAERLRRLVQRRQPHGILHPAGADQRRRFRTPG